MVISSLVETVFIHVGIKENKMANRVVKNRILQKNKNPTGIPRSHTKRVLKFHAIDNWQEIGATQAHTVVSPMHSFQKCLGKDCGQTNG